MGIYVAVIDVNSSSKVWNIKRIHSLTTWVPVFWDSTVTLSVDESLVQTSFTVDSNALLSVLKTIGQVGNKRSRIYRWHHD